MHMIGLSCKDPNWINFFSLANEIQKAGFTHVELCIYDMEYDSCLFQDQYLKQVKKYLEKFHFTASVHMIQGINLAEKVPRIRQAAIDILKDTITIAGKLEAQWVTVHLGSAGFSNKNKLKKEQRLQYAIESLQQVEPMLMEQNIKLALENLPNMPDGQQKCKIGSSPDEFIYLFRMLNNKYYRMLFDFGHANIYKPTENYIEAFAQELTEHVIAYHVHFNDGKEDMHVSLPHYEKEVEKHLPVLKLHFSRGIPFIFESYTLSENMESLTFLQQKIKMRQRRK